jgi:bla regulator protein blaR1
MRLIDGRMPWAGRYGLVCSVCCWMGMVVVCVGAMWFGIRPSAAQGMHMVPLYGQILHADGSRPSFEVATIRRLPNGPPPAHGTTPPGVVRYFFTVKMLVMFAYNLPDFSESRIKGPSWMDDQYVVEAKIEESQYAAMEKMAPAEKNQQMQLMVQSLLADRFKLEVHFDTVEMTMYELVVAKGGSKLTPAQAGLPKRFAVVRKGPVMELDSTGTTADGLAALLGRQVEAGGRTVVNRTGLPGEYDIAMRWTPQTQGIDAAVTPDSDAPSYFTAIQEQLGLRLSPTKKPVDFIVIDHIEKPSEN